MPLNINQFFVDKSALITGKQAQQTHRFVLRVKGIDSALITNVTIPKYKITTTITPINISFKSIYIIHVEYYSMLYPLISFNVFEPTILLIL